MIRDIKKPEAAKAIAFSIDHADKTYSLGTKSVPLKKRAVNNGISIYIHKTGPKIKENIRLALTLVSTFSILPLFLFWLSLF